jgi:hypothetical protein
MISEERTKGTQRKRGKQGRKAGRKKNFHRHNGRTLTTQSTAVINVMYRY